MPYKVIAHRHPEALGGRRFPYQTAPALVADDQGRLAVVHDGQRQFVPMSPDNQREAMEQVAGEPHNWYRYPEGSQHDWTPGSVVKVGVDGSSYLDSVVPVLSPDDDEPDDAGTEANGDVLSELLGPPRTAPRQQGKPQTMRGRAINDGVLFVYEMPLTTCVSCVNLQPGLLHIKPCRMPGEAIGYADFGFYTNNGGCPFYQFGMTIPERMETEDDDDTSDMVRGALIQALGGHVTGTVSRKVALVGPPATTNDGEEPDLTPNPENRKRGELHTDGEDYALHEELGSFNNEPKPTRISTSPRYSGKPLEEGVARTEIGTSGSDLNDDDLMEWYDGEHQTRATSDPYTEALIDKCDSLPHETRIAVLTALHRECGLNGDNFDAAVRTFRDYLEAAEPSEEVRADNPTRGINTGTQATAFSPDAFPFTRRGQGD